MILPTLHPFIAFQAQVRDLRLVPRGSDEEKAFWDDLYQKLLKGVRHSSIWQDLDLAALCYHAHRSVDPDLYSSSSLACRAMLAEGRAWTLSELHKALGDHASQMKSVQAWAESRRIPACFVGHHYVSSTYGQALVRLFTQSETVVVAAEMLGISYTTLKGRIARGTVEAFTGPDRTGRILNTELARLLAEKAARPDRSSSQLTLAQAAAHIGVSLPKLTTEVHFGRVKSTGLRDTRAIEFDEAERWRVKLRQLNSGFEWLQSEMDATPGGLPTKKAGDVSSQMGIDPSFLAKLADLNLLPFVERSFVVSAPHRHFIATYIDKLVEFVGGNLPVTKRQVKSYAEHCRLAGSIV